MRLLYQLLVLLDLGHMQVLLLEVLPFFGFREVGHGGPGSGRRAAIVLLLFLVLWIHSIR